MGCGKSSSAKAPRTTVAAGREGLPKKPTAPVAPADPPAPTPHKPVSTETPPQFSNAAEPEPTPAITKEPSADDGGDGDDFAWVTAALDASVIADDSPPAWAVSSARGSEAEPTLTVKVQVLLEGGWKDSSEEETLQICQHIANKERQFQIKARGQMYTIILDGADGFAWQVNEKTQKKRKMRVLDSDEPADTGPVRSASKAAVDPNVAQQQEWGPQSKRGGASQHPMQTLKDNTHAQGCFAMFAKNEEKLSGEWAVFYHSYSFAALIYEVHAAVGAVLFRFRSQYATLPRILVHEFNSMFPKGPDARILMDLFNTKYAANKRDHHPEFRAVALSVMCNLVATGPECCPPAVFISGYSCKDLVFRGVLENVLESCYVPKKLVKRLADDIIALSEEHGLDVSQFGGKPCKSGMAGHILQIFMKRNLVDTLCYPAKPYGPIDTDRLPLSDSINTNKSCQVGQARIIAHPKYFMQANLVRCYVASADKTFHDSREAFQVKLTGLLNVILGEPSLRLKAATGIYGGKLPSWWSDEDQRSKGSIRSASGPVGGSPDK